MWYRKNEERSNRLDYQSRGIGGAGLLSHSGQPSTLGGQPISNPRSCGLRVRSLLDSVQFALRAIIRRWLAYVDNHYVAFKVSRITCKFTTGSLTYSARTWQKILSVRSLPRDYPTGARSTPYIGIGTHGVRTSWRSTARVTTIGGPRRQNPTTLFSIFFLTV